jgi:hypothetical protein
MPESSGPVERRGFALFLPDGFIELPAGDLDEAGFGSLAAAVSAEFGADPAAGIDQGTAETAVMLAATAAMADAGGSTYTAAGFFRSPDDPDRPIMVLVTCMYVDSDHATIDTAIAALHQAQRATATGPVEIADLQAGPAVITQSATPDCLDLGDDGTMEIVSHAITAWIPGPGAILGIAVTSNTAEDWDHVGDLARGIFDTVEWDTQEEHAS